MTKQRTIIKYVFISAFSLLASITICTNYDADNILSVFSNTSFFSTVLFALILFFSVMLEKIKKEVIKGLWVLSTIIAVIWTFGFCYQRGESPSFLFSSNFKILLFVLFTLGRWFIVLQIGYLLYYCLEKGKNKLSCVDRIPLVQFYRKHVFFSVFIVLMLAWLPHIIVSLPAYVNYDAWYQLNQYFGVIEFNAIHPVIHTLIVSKLVELGTFLGNANIGFTIYIIGQSIVFALIISHLHQVLRRMESPIWLRLGSLAISCIVPYYSYYTCIVIKDTLYSAFFLLFVIEFICILYYKNDYFSSWKNNALLSISICGTYLFRHNGKFVLIPVILLVAVFIVFKLKIKSAHLIKVLSVLVIPLILSASLSYLLTNAFNVKKGSVGETMSIMFQQTARYVKEYPDEVTPEEKASISEVLDYEKLDDIYNPMISDPVKRTFKTDAETDDLVNYAKSWAIMFFKHPLTYFSATLNQNYLLLFPFAEDQTLFSETYVEGIWESVSDYVPQVSTNHNTSYNTGILLLNSVPVIGVFSSVACYNILLLFLIVFWIKKKKAKHIISTLPIILCNLINVLAPAVLYNYRYSLPIVYSLPVIVAYYIVTVKSDKEIYKK